MPTVITRTGSGESARSEGPYTGELWRDYLLAQNDDGPTAAAIFFTPCGRTYWHSHPGGQLLIVEHGEGLVADADGIVRVRAGDMVWTPPNVRHWHGGTSTRSMMHVAVTFNGVTWEDEVSDEDYAAANSSA